MARIPFKKASKKREERRPAAQPPKGVFSYYNNRAPQVDRGDAYVASTSGRARRTGKAWLRNLPSLVALAAVTLSVLYCLSLTSQPRVTVIIGETKESSLRDKAEYQAGAQKILEQSLLNRTKFTINTRSFEKAFQTEFPEVSDVAISLPLINRQPIVTITTAQPTMILVANNRADVLDSRGMVIMSANDLSSEARRTLPVVKDEGNVELAPGKTVLPAAYITYITSVMAQLNAKKITAETITLPKQPHELDVKVAGQPYFVKFSFDTDAREAAGTYLATKSQLDSQKITPAKYVDVRVPGRAYYQ
jgi:hypothetical protein